MYHFVNGIKSFNLFSTTIKQVLNTHLIPYICPAYNHYILHIQALFPLNRNSPDNRPARAGLAVMIVGKHH